MAANPTISIQFQVRNPETTSKFLFTDGTDWAGMGINPLNVNIAIRVYRPDGVLWYAGSHSPPDIAPSVSLTNNLIGIPTGSDNLVIEGTYRIEAEAVVTGPTEPGTWTSTYTPNLAYCRDLPTPVITWDINCIAGPIVAAADGTSYGLWTVTSRDISIFAPANARPPYNTSYTSTGLSVNSGSDSVITGLWTCRLEVEIYRDYGTHSVTYTLTQAPNDIDIPSAEQTVICMRLCEVKCCVDKAYTRWQTAKTSGYTKEATSLYNQWAEAVQLLWMAWFSSDNCQDDSKTNAYISQIQAVLSCDDTCGDCNDQEGIITPISGSSSSYTFGTDTPAYIIVSESGGLVKYSLTTAAADTLTNVRNTAIGLSAGMLSAGFTLLGPVPTGSNPILNSYTLGFTGTFPSATQQYKALLAISRPAGVLTFTRTDEVVYGTDYQAPTTLEPYPMIGYTTAIIRVQGFWAAAPALTYKPMVETNYIDYLGGASPTGMPGLTATISVVSNNELYIIMRDPTTGMPVTWNWIFGVVARSFNITLTIE